jgi:adenine-specific DNA glycosylase
MVAVIIEKRRKFLISQRPAKTVNGSLWEFPSIEWTSEMEPTPETLGSALNLTLQGLAPFAMLRHSITRYRIELTALRATAASSPAGRWVSRKVLATLPMSAAHRKLAQRLLHPSA